MQGPVSEEDGSITCSEVITTNASVSPNSQGSEDQVVGETSDGETKEKTGFQDSDGSKQATPPKLHQPELVRGSEQEITPSNQISVEDYLAVEEQMDSCAIQNTKELENMYSVLDIQMDDIDTLKDVGMSMDSCFHHSNEVLNSWSGSDMVVESSEARQLGQEDGTVLEKNVPKDVEHELQMKEMDLEKLIYSSGQTEVSFRQISEEIEEGEISGDADESFDALSEGAPVGEETTENLHASEGYLDRDEFLFDRGHQQYGNHDPSLVNIVNIESNSKKVKSRTPAGQLQDYYSLDVPRGSHIETPESSDIPHCLDNLTPPGTILRENAAGNQISVSTEQDENAGKNKRKRGLTKERRAKKKKKERIKRAEKNRELGVKRLKLPTVLKPKKIVHCRHYLQGRCHEGEKCKFSHDTVPLTKSKPCGHFARHSCMKGDHCPYDHQLSKYPCNNFSLNGFCNRGSECMFSHEMPGKSLSATPSVPKHDLISPQQTGPEKQGSHPISKVNKSELKVPSPLNNPNSNRPLDSRGISHQKVNSGLCSAANSPGQREQLALKPVPRTGGQAPRGVSFLSNRAVPLGDTNKEKQDGSSANRTDGFGAGCRGTVNVLGGTNELNGMSEVVAPRKPQGINFLSFGQPPSDDSSNKILSNLLSNFNDRIGKSAIDDKGKGKLTCSLAQGAGPPNANRQMNESAISLVSNVTEKANGTSLTVPQNVKFLSFNRSPLDVSNTNLDSSKGETASSFVKEKQNTSKLQGSTGTPSPSFGRPLNQSTGGWNANLSCSFKTSLFSNTPSLVQKAVQSTLACAAQLEADIKVGSSHQR